MRTNRLLVAIVLSACNDSSSDRPDAPLVIPDAAPDAFDPPPNVVSIDAFGEVPVFIRYRTRGGEWRVPDQTAAGYELRTFEDYELVAVCGDAANGFDVGFESSTFDESLGFTFLPCFPTSFSNGTVNVTGTMVQAGRVSFVGEATSAGPNWNFGFDVDPGTYDLIAIGAGRALLRRAIDVAVPTTLPTVDTTAAGSAAITTLPLTLNGVEANDTTSTRVFLATQNSFGTVFNGPGSTAQLVPASLLQATDGQYLSVRVGNSNFYRTVFVRHTATSPTTFTLLPRLSGIQFTADTATWSSIPAGDANLYLGAGLTTVHIRATQNWIAGKTTLAIDTDIPGYQPEWRLETNEYRDFNVDTFAAGVTLRTGFFAFPTVQRRLDERRAQHERLRATRATRR